METIQNIKDQVVGGAKSAVGAMTGNEEWQKEGEQQKQQHQAKESSSAKPNPVDEIMKELPAEESLDMHLKKGKVFEEMGSKTKSKDMTNEGKQMQKEARAVKEFQETQDKVAGRNKEIVFPREKDEDQKEEEKETDSSLQSSIMDTISTVKDKIVEGAKSAFGSLTGNEDEKQRDLTHDPADFKFAGHTKETFSKDTKKGREEEDKDTSQHSSVKDTLSSVKDKVVGEAKSAVGAMTGNEEWQKEGEQQKELGEMTTDIHLQKGKVFEEMGAKTKSKDMTSEGKQMQKEASAVKEFQETQDIIAGRSKEHFSSATDKDEEKEDEKKQKKEGDFHREKGEDTKKEHEEETDSTQQSSIMETLYTVKDKIVGGAKSAIGSLTGNEDLKNEGERQKVQTHDAYATPQFDPKKFEENHQNEGQIIKEDQKKAEHSQRERGEETKKEQEEESSSAMKTMSTVKDKVVGGAKSAIGSLTGNEDMKKEGERQKDQGYDIAQGKTDELSVDMHLKKGKVFEEMGEKTESKDMISEGKQMQKEARAVKEWQDTQDKLIGLATGKEDMKNEGHFQRERSEATK